MSTLMIRKDFSAIEKKFMELSTNETFVKEVGFALQVINQSPQLQKCSKDSLLSSVLQVASIGLSLNPVKKESYLVPRWNSAKRCMEGQLMPSYQGLIKLVTDTGSVKNVYCNLVYEQDVFDVELGSDQKVTHKPRFKSKDIERVYAIAVLPDGTNQIEVMDVEDIKEIRERSDAYQAFKSGKLKTTVWESDFGEMCRKTVLRRLYKYLPKTDKWERLSNAIAQDEQEFVAPDFMIYKIQDLMVSSSIDLEEAQQIEMELNGNLSIKRANEIINRLNAAQTDAISSGRNYNQTDIKNKLEADI